MNISQILRSLKARIKIVLFTFLITVLTATVVSLLLPNSYKATTQLVANYNGTDSVTGTVNQSQLATTSYMATQQDIIKSDSTAIKVVDALHLADNKRMREKFLTPVEQLKERLMGPPEQLGDLRNWLAGKLASKLEIDPSRESNVIQLSFTDTDPKFAADVANAFANAYLSLSTQLKVEPAQHAAAYFDQQTKAFRDNLVQAQTRLSKYQQEKGITSADERVDVETTRLTELSDELVKAQSSAIEAKSRQNSALSNEKDSPDVALNPVVQSLRVDAAKAESKLVELSNTLGKNHPQYEAAEAELHKIQSQLQNEVRRTSNSITGTANIQQQREDELRSKVAMQKAEVLKLNRTRDELSVLQKDVDTAQKALDAVTQRFSQTNIEGQSNQSDIAILSLAKAPTWPHSPRVLLNILLSVFLGGLLGAAFGLIAELMDRRVRSSDDIASLLNVPVVALIKNKPTVTGLKLLPGQPGRFLPSA
jgi:succinoglycan biosynthesis transport protein ExoP